MKLWLSFCSRTVIVLQLQHRVITRYTPFTRGSIHRPTWSKYEAHV